MKPSPRPAARRKTAAKLAWPPPSAPLRAGLATALWLSGCGDTVSGGSSVEECTVDADCPQLTCRVASCLEGACSHAIAEPGSPCEQHGDEGTCSSDGACLMATPPPPPEPPPPHTIRALAVVADFADAVLEDYSGDGFTTESEIRETLDSMEDHWAWMSQGTQIVEWDLVRITLPTNLAGDAYPSWPVFRESVVDLVSESVDFGDYDSDSNGVVDGMFIIASNAEVDCPFLVGGAARAGDACTFVDGQASLSARVRAVGNFNHELGHCRGLPDAYGTYATLFYLTLMHSSWPVPPHGFSAFDRMKLGWTEPTLVSQTTTAITLPPAEKSLAALRIATARPDEYFLIEFRKRPDHGYGSSTDIAYDGLAVYHVFEPSRQAVDPPRIRLVPADSLIAAGIPPEADDFLSPENAAMPNPFEVQGYFSPDPVFGIANVARSEEGMTFDVFVPPTPAETPSVNLLVNGSFEDGSGPEPDGWATTAWRPESATFVWEPDLAWEGSRSVGIMVPPEGRNDARWTREVTGLSAGSGYLLCGWLKGEDIEVPGSGGVGANLTVMGPSAHSYDSGLGTFDWTRHCVAFMAQETMANLGCRLGFFGSTAFGNMWCDGLELFSLPSAF